MRDGVGREIDYLRISVTDRCNFRCVYCMPLQGLEWIPNDDILTADEIERTARELVSLGLRKIRLTGGEPTLRRDLLDIIRRLRAIDGVADIALSTNGVRLPAMARALRDAGLDRVNMSVDSLRADRIAAIARRSLAFDPRAALAAALDAGLGPVKVNVVVIRGTNDDEVGDLAALSLELPVHVRFIELMPVGDMASTEFERVVPSAEVLDTARARLGSLVSDIGPSAGNGPARYYRAVGAPGTIGVITPMTHTYCETCNRVRLTADGRLRTCLFGDDEVDLRSALRRGEPLAPLVRVALANKPRQHALLQLRVGGLAALSQTGG